MAIWACNPDSRLPLNHNFQHVVHRVCKAAVVYAEGDLYSCDRWDCSSLFISPTGMFLIQTSTSLSVTVTKGFIMVQFLLGYLTVPVVTILW